MNLRVLALLLLVLFFFFAVTGTSAEEGEKLSDEELGFRLSEYDVGISLAEDASSRTSFRTVMKVVDKNGLRTARRESLSHSTSAEELIIDEAYTLKADGKKIKVPESNYQIEENKGRTKNSPAFSDRTHISIIFPDLEVGDSRVVQYRIIGKQQYFEGHYSQHFLFSPEVAYDSVSIKFDYPVSLPLKHEVYKLKEGSSKEADGRRYLSWDFAQSDPIREKRHGSYVYEFGSYPTLAFSTFDNYEQIAKAYKVHADSKAIVTDEIRSLAEEISGDASKTKEITRSLYNWVQEEIAYAGNCIGVGAVVPRDLSFVLKNRMGDCKDHATLLETLLQAKGIESTQVLIGVNQSYELPKLPLVSAVNHVMNYIPELDLYLDATDSRTPFGSLNWYAGGRPVLHVENYLPEQRSPSVGYEGNRETMDLDIAIDEDGVARGVLKVKLTGRGAFGQKKRYEELTPHQLEEMNESILESNKYRGEALFRHDFPDNSLENFTWAIDFRIDSFVDLESAGSISFSSPFGGSRIKQMLPSNTEDGPASRDFICSGAIKVENYTIRLPENIEILAKPKDRAYENSVIDFQSRYETKENTVEASRTYKDMTKGPICAPEIDVAYKEHAESVLKDLRSQLVYRPTE